MYDTASRASTSPVAADLSHSVDGHRVGAPAARVPLREVRVVASGQARRLGSVLRRSRQPHRGRDVRHPAARAKDPRPEALYILRASPQHATALADAIREVKERIGLCEVCFNLAEGPRCRICDDTRRDPGLICIVAEAPDVMPVERTHEYGGRYHALGGALSPIDGVDPEDLKLAELFARATGPG